MSDISKKVAYLKGLAEGLDIKEGKEGKLLNAIIDVLNDMAAEIDDLSDYCDEVVERFSDLSDEVSDIEESLYGEGGELAYADDDDDDDWLDDDAEYSFECPECGETIYIDLETLESDEEYIICPNCKKKIELDFDSDCGIDPDCGSCGLCGDDDDDEDED